jgi:hypothetical protein
MVLEYFIVVFENGEKWFYHGDEPVPAKKEAKKRGTQIKYILCGRNNPLGEFVPRLCWDKNGDKDEAQLLIQLLERGMNSSNLSTVALSAMITKYLMKEIANAR